MPRWWLRFLRLQDFRTNCIDHYFTDHRRCWSLRIWLDIQQVQQQTSDHPVPYHIDNSDQQPVLHKFQNALLSHRSACRFRTFRCAGRQPYDGQPVITQNKNNRILRIPVCSWTHIHCHWSARVRFDIRNNGQMVHKSPGGG